jgi:NAD(P)-dependent dehydrogenase (short-subunit alcohol dehydrogenase family)
MGKLEGKIALITGGSSGIGLATSKQFVNEGAYVFITGRREPELAAAVKEIGRNVTGVQGDVSNLGDLDHLFAQIKREKGKPDIVFANAGVANPMRSPRPLCFSHPTTAATSPARNCLWMAASHKCRP